MANGRNSRCRARTSVQRRSQKAEVSRDQHLSTDRDQGLEPEVPAVPLPSLACFYPDITAQSFLLLSALLSVGIIQRGRGAAAGIWKHVSFRRAARSSSLFPRRRNRGLLLPFKLALMFRQNGTQSGLNNISERLAFRLPHTEDEAPPLPRCPDPLRSH